MKGVIVEAVERFGDHRGELIKCLPRGVEGEVYAVTTWPGESRADHYHRVTGEWFLTLAGEGVLLLEDIESGAVEEIALDGVRVFVPPGVAHRLENRGEGEWVVLALADHSYDPADTIPHEVATP